MKVKLYMDLHDTCLDCNKLQIAQSEMSYPVMKDYIKYLESVLVFNNVKFEARI